jgi:hypothetical protein
LAATDGSSRRELFYNAASLGHEPNLPNAGQRFNEVGTVQMLATAVLLFARGGIECQHSTAVTGPLNRGVERREGETLQYTDYQRVAFKHTYAKRFRRQLVMIMLLFAVMASLALTRDGATFFGLSVAVLGPITLIVALVAWVIFSARNWRCPACHKSLGRAFNPRHCRWCGVELRG